MTILFVTHGTEMMGANKSLFNLIAGLEKYAVEVIVLTPDEGRLVDMLQEKQKKVIISPYYRWAHTRFISKDYWLNALNQRKNAQVLQSLISEVQPLQVDLIYTNTSIVGIGIQLAQALNIPHVWRIREFGEEDYNLAFFGGRRTFKHWANQSTAISFISKAIANKFAELTPLKSCIYNGIMSHKEMAAIVPKKNLCAQFTFMIIGLIHPNKGQLEALKAFHQVHKKQPNTKLYIVGKGRRLYTKRLQLYIKQHALEQAVELTGHINNPQAMYEKTDCCLVCSKSEGMGRVTIEAMAHGIPVIGYAGGATPELIHHQKNGLIYHNIDELVKHMLALGSNINWYTQLAQQARQDAFNYTTNISVEKEYALLKKVISS